MFVISDESQLLGLCCLALKKIINYSSNVVFVGAFACVQLQFYEEAISWCHKGLAVSFDECFNTDILLSTQNKTRRLPFRILVNSDLWIPCRKLSASLL